MKIWFKIKQLFLDIYNPTPFRWKYVSINKKCKFKWIWNLSLHCKNNETYRIQTAQKIGLCKSRDNDNLLIKRNLLWKIYSYTTVMVMCPKQQQNANWSQVEIENLIVRGRNLPRTNCTKFETQNIFAKISKTNTAQNLALPYFFKRKWMFIMYIY